ncbi:MAG: Spy/CpxP family protein refolding chaperone [Thiobacillaceae bacterium]
MNALNPRSPSGIAALSLSAVIFCFSVPAFSDNAPAASTESTFQPTTPRLDCCNQSGTRHARLRMRLSARLDRMADRLEISASQQGAWGAYRAVVIGLADGSPPTRPAADADAAALLRYRAERAGEMAQTLAKLADATSTLQAALSPEQRAVLDEMTHRFQGVRGRKSQFSRVPGKQ